MIQRNTKQRALVLSAVAELKGHPTAEEIYTYLHKTHPGISKATVYRNLSILCDNENLYRLSLPNEADRFDYAKQEHYHVKCVVCGKLEDIAVPSLQHFEKILSSETGYDLHTYNIVFEGICPSCKKHMPR